MPELPSEGRLAVGDTADKAVDKVVCATGTARNGRTRSIKLFILYSAGNT